MILGFNLIWYITLALIVLRLSGALSVPGLLIAGLTVLSFLVAVTEGRDT